MGLNMAENDKPKSKAGLARKIAGGALAVPGGIAGAATLGSLTDAGYLDSAKFGAKATYNKITGDKESEEAAGREWEESVKNRRAKERKRNTGDETNAAGDAYKKGGTVKPNLSKLFKGKESQAEEMKEAKAIKSGKITPKQYAMGEKMEEKKKMMCGGKVKKMATGGAVKGKGCATKGVKKARMV